jgi:DNA polymerase
VSSDPENELASVIASAQELLRWEHALGGPGFPASVAGEPGGAAHQRPEADLEVHARLQALAEEAARCTRCELHRGRTHSVFARGTPDTDLVFVGEGPGYHEDQQGLPFVGRAGQLLDRMIAAMGYDRDGVYICNVVKCRPPDNRTPLPSEAASCARFLTAQLELIRPRVIVALGRCAAENLQCVPPAGRWRGTWGEWRGIPVMPTYHPAFLLRSPQFKKAVWEDLQEVLRLLNREVPKRAR